MTVKVNKLWIVLGIILALIIGFLFLGPFYIIEEGQQAVVLRMGKIVSVDTEAGLKFKLPLIDNVIHYPKKILSWDGRAQEIRTRPPENKYIFVDTTARWRIVDPVLFFQTLNTLNSGYKLLDEIIDSEVRTIINNNLLYEVVRNSNVINQRQAELEVVTIETPGEMEAEIEEQQEGGVTTEQKEYPLVESGRIKLSEYMLDNARTAMYKTKKTGDGKAEAVLRNGEPYNQYGIELIDIVIRQIEYPEKVTLDVYQAMITERKQIAEKFRSQGQGLKQEWLGKKDRELKRIISEAKRDANSIMGAADQKASAIYAEAYNLDADFFEFWRAIQSYREILPKFKKTLTTDAEYFKYLYDQRGR
ncbi:MAG: protease modulator HflC [Spirochaetales bacterium]|nr:protease modulator HflC [Spirochaetales bacterium]